MYLKDENVWNDVIYRNEKMKLKYLKDNVSVLIP